MLNHHAESTLESAIHLGAPAALFLTRRQVATYLNMSEKWLAQAGRSSGPTFHKFGGRCRYRLDDVDNWARQQRVTK